MNRLESDVERISLRGTQPVWFRGVQYLYRHRADRREGLQVLLHHRRSRTSCYHVCGEVSEIQNYVSRSIPGTRQRLNFIVLICCYRVITGRTGRLRTIIALETWVTETSDHSICIPGQCVVRDHSICDVRIGDSIDCSC